MAASTDADSRCCLSTRGCAFQIWRFLFLVGSSACALLYVARGSNQRAVHATVRKNTTTHIFGGSSDKGVGPNLVHGSQHPDVVVFGIGDSGTRGFTDYLSHAGGVHMCEGNRNPRTLDCNPTKECQLNSSSPLWKNQASHPVRLSTAAYEAASSELFQEIVQCELLQSKEVLDGIRKKHQFKTNDSFFWGYKNPKHAYLLPVMREAFGDNTGMIMVARHPYDICSGKNQGQYTAFGHSFGNNSKKRPSCMEFWFQVASQVLLTIEANPRTMRIVRIETLVLDTRRRKERAGRCIADLLGYDYSQRLNLEATTVMAKHSGSYGGRSRVGDQGKEMAVSRSKTGKMFEKAKRDTDAKMERMAEMLGYNMSAYSAWGTVDELLPKATSSAVC